MTSPTTQSSDARRWFQIRIWTESPVRIGVMAVIVLSLCLYFFHVVPSVHRDLQLLSELRDQDAAGLRLESDLQLHVHDSRRRFMNILLMSRSPQEASEDRQALRETDDAVTAIIAQIAKLNAVPADNQRQVRESWQHYLSVRDRMLNAPLATLPDDRVDQARKVDADLGKTAFLPVDAAVHDAELAVQATLAQRAQLVSDSLHQALREVEAFCILKGLALGCFLWLDWRRLRAESQLLRTSANLKASEERFRMAYASASVGMGIIRMDGTVVSANPRAANLLGYTPEELVGTKITDIMPPKEKEDLLERFASLATHSDGGYQVERQVIRKDGSPAWVRNSVTLMRPEGQEPHFFAISEEITEQKRANDRLAFLANFDPVTNLPNRHYFEAHLADALETATASDGVALLYVEIDSFDFLKGTFGRTVADEVLSDLGASLTSFCREEELVGRLDDSVFGILVRAVAYDEAALSRANELRDLFHSTSSSGRHRIPLSASIGIAYSEAASTQPLPSRTVGGRYGAITATKSETAAETLIKYGRAAMLEARSRGGDSIFLADPALQERAAQRHQIESALLNGLREDEFRVVFQPQFQVATGKLMRFEALCRWTSQELGPIPPDRFIPIAEQTGLITEIGRRILLESLRQAKTWTDSGRNIGVAVNISPMQFMRPDFTAAITEALAITNFPPALLELEITEGIFIRDLNLAVARIRELQRLGLSVALDDFGTGYSSLSYLQRMPIDAVKLDRSFVSDLTTDAATVSMVKSVLAMAGALNLRVVTEGVETEEQMNILRSLGCEEAQGYLLGRPESADMALRRVLESPLQPVATLV